MGVVVIMVFKYFTAGMSGLPINEQAAYLQSSLCIAVTKSGKLSFSAY